MYSLVMTEHVFCRSPCDETLCERQVGATVASARVEVALVRALLPAGQRLRQRHAAHLYRQPLTASTTRTCTVSHSLQAKSVADEQTEVKLSLHVLDIASKCGLQNTNF